MQHYKRIVNGIRANVNKLYDEGRDYSKFSIINHKLWRLAEKRKVNVKASLYLTQLLNKKGN